MQSVRASEVSLQVMKSARISVFILCASALLLAGEPAPTTAPTPGAAPKAPEAGPTELQKLELYEDKDAGFSLRIPSGFARLTESENREVFKGLSDYFGKQIGDRALRRPPAWFRGPSDAKNSKLLPPSLAIGYTDMVGVIDPSRLSTYKEEIEKEYKKRGEMHGDIIVTILTVSGVNALRIEHDLISPIDNSRSRIVKVAVPGGERRYDIVLNYSPEQTEQVEPALATALNTFKIDTKPVIDAETKSQWTRVAMWTGGMFVLGVVLSLLLKVLSGVGEKQPEKS
jgi:hypothetical protein